MSRFQDELFDVVDEHDRVIGQAPRHEVHARNLLHRAVHVFVFDSQHRLLLQLRSTTKDQYPSCYTSSASGHVDAGESYETAARRELAEELHLATDIHFVTKLPNAGPETAYEHTALFFTHTDEILEFDTDEIATVEFRTLQSIHDEMSSTSEQFTPSFCALIQHCDENRLWPDN